MRSTGPVRVSEVVVEICLGQGPQEFPITGCADKEGDGIEGSQSPGFSFVPALILLLEAIP